MCNGIVVCLDGSRFAERIIPYARGVAQAAGAGLTLLRVVDYGEEVSGVENYVETWSRLLQARAKIVEVESGVAATILRELQREPDVLPAMTTHGYTGIWEPVLGSVALAVIRDVGRPVLLYGSRRAPKNAGGFEPAAVVAAVDGGEFSEQILPAAAALARSLKVSLELIQAMPRGSHRLPAELRGDVSEDSYLQSCAGQIEKQYGIKASWEVLHGAPGKAICSHVRGREGVILAMTSHARPALRHAMFGSVAGDCVRHAGVPMLIYRPTN